nr:hypothetical protein [Asaia platycodi]
MAHIALADHTDSFFIPCVTLIGPGCARQAGDRAKRLGQKRP